MTTLETLSACPVCHSKNIYLWLQDVGDILENTSEKFSIFRCEDCHHGFTNPRPKVAEMMKYYTGGYYTHAPSSLGTDLSWMKRIKRFARAASHWLFGGYVSRAECFGNGKILDIGCGNGNQLVALHRKGWTCFGTEVDDVCAKLARQALPSSQIWKGRLSDIRFPQESQFSMIIMSHVLEHIHETTADLYIVRSCIADQGRLVVRVPNARGIEARIFGRYWRGLEMPRHLHHFSLTSIQTQLEKSGFKVISIECQGLPMSFAESFGYLMHEKFGLPDKNRKRLQRVVYSITYIPLHLLAKLGFSTAIEIIAEPVTDNNFQNGDHRA
jgi:SAM-dependent methyltransferase